MIDEKEFTLTHCSKSSIHFFCFPFTTGDLCCKNTHDFAARWKTDSLRKTKRVKPSRAVVNLPSPHTPTASFPTTGTTCGLNKLPTLGTRCVHTRTSMA